ncbi:hypothetical protein ACFQH9_26100, partial [Pseudonocardia lutea]
VRAVVSVAPVGPLPLRVSGSALGALEPGAVAAGAVGPDSAEAPGQDPAREPARSADQETVP